MFVVIDDIKVFMEVGIEIVVLRVTTLCRTLQNYTES
jgi:hypothetical protein